MTETTTSQKPRKRGVVLAALFLLLAVGAFAGAVVWAGGIDKVAELVGVDLADLGIGSGGGHTADNSTVNKGSDSDEGSSTADSGEATGSVEPTSNTGGATTGAGDNDADDADGVSGPPAGAYIPVSAAQAAMYREQLQSQVQINKLVDGSVASIGIGTASASASKAVIPLSVSYKTDPPLSGTLVLVNTNGLWYFSSISAADHSGSASPVKPQNVDSGVVSTITEQQADPDCQKLIEEGLVEGGFKTARVDGVSAGAGTATVNVTLLGGTMDRTPARFVLISKVDSGKKYWFLTRFELK